MAIVGTPKLEYIFNGNIVTAVIMSADDSEVGNVGVEVNNAEVSLIRNQQGDLNNAATVKTKLLEKFEAEVARRKQDKTGQATKEATEAAEKAKISLSISKADLDAVITGGK